MKIELPGKPEIIISNEISKHNYFAWPSIERLKDGRIAVTCSGYRLSHICPFGKACLSFSIDDGETFSKPMPVIDTPLDDRDAGITAFGESCAIVTSFNNTLEFQRNEADNDEYKLSYINKVTKEEEEKYLGAEFTISRDNCTTFGDVHLSPVTSPHGITVLKDGTLLWVGRTFSETNAYYTGKKGVVCYEVKEDGTFIYRGNIPTDTSLQFCEPHTVQCDDGKLLCHLRSDTEFTLYQSVSCDGGFTWTEPERLLPEKGGAPSHILKHSSGVLIATYGYREKPYGIKAMFSYDNGKTWDTDYRIYSNDISDDLGYPATVELKDGSLLTVFYANHTDNSHAVILKQKWSFTK